MAFWLGCGAGLLLGVVILLLVKIHLLRKSAGEIAEAFAQRLAVETNTLMDISSRDRAMGRLASSLNRELKALRDQRRRFQQGDLEVKEAITNISHDLRTPLTAICGYLDLLKGEDLSPQAARYLALIENRVGAMKELAEELFSYSLAAGGREPARERVDLCRALEECLLSFYGTMKQRGIQPEVRLPEGPVERLLDPAALARVFGNITGNALKYSDGDFVVELDGSGRVTFANQAESLAAVDVARLFDRFYTVETGRGSTGIGLSIARLLTERMGGSISAAYEEGLLRITVVFL